MKTIPAKVVAVTFFGVASLVAASDVPRPNFILINIDDLGYADIGPFGSNNRTPNLDRMAKEGRRLTSHYAAPVCSPSRAALMTGCYPKRALPIPHVLFPAGAVGLNPEERTVAEVLRDAGYATACIGKWHLGDQPEFLPTRQGFDSYFGIPYSNDMGPAADGAKSNPGEQIPGAKDLATMTARQTQVSGEETGIRGGNQPPLPLVENERVVGRVRAAEQFEITRRYTERAVEFVRKKREGPFFLYMPHTAVHFPLHPGKDFMGKSPNGLIGDWTEEVDWSVGQILDAVRGANIAEKTLVLFTSDNGGALRFGSNNGPLRGTKGQTLEGGIRVCTIAWWPGKIPAGTSTDAITTMMDILPTFARLAGARVPDDRKIDGIDIWSVMSGEPSKEPRETFFYFRGFKLEAVRSGLWKLHLALADSQPKAKKGRPREQLFNLREDIGETRDLASAHPDEVARLRALADSMRGDLGMDDIGPGCRPLGRVANPQPLIGYDGTVRPEFAGEQRRFP